MGSSIVNNEKIFSKDNSEGGIQPYSRTSTLLPHSTPPVQVKTAYEQWMSKLFTPPSEIKVRGIAKKPAGIIGGALVPMSLQEKNTRIEYVVTPSQRCTCEECIPTDL